MSLTTVSVSRPVTTTMFFVGLALLGTIAFTQMSVNFLPSIQIPELLVQTDYPDAPAEQVEKVVTKPIESVLATVGGVKKVTSISRNGSSLITLSFSWGTDINYSMLEVREKLDEIRSTLPKEVGRSTIYKIDPSTESIITIALQYSGSEQNSNLPLSSAFSQSGGEFVHLGHSAGSDPEFLPQQFELEKSLSNLRELAESLIKRRFEQLNGVSQAVVAGGTEREVYVEIDYSKLQALGLTFEDVSEALKNSNLNIESGTILKGVFRYPIRTVGEFQSLQDIKNTNVSNGHVMFRLGDFANVFEGFAEREGLTRVNGREAILIYIKKDAGANTIEVSKEVNSAVTELNREYPTIKLTTLIDQAEFINKSINDIEQAILFGALLALLVLFLFLRNPRYPLIVGVVTPFSILMTVILMYFFGINFNIISLTGLALGIGMIGDNAIIIVENFSRLREQGYTITNAVIEGSKEINLSVAASTFTNVAVFLPIVFVKGIAQKLFLDMGITMTLSLLASLLVAITLVPTMLTRIKHPARGGEHDDIRRKRVTKLGTAIQLVYEKMRSFYLKLLDYSLENSLKILLLTFLLTVLAAGIVFLIPSEEAPDIDQSRFVVQISLPPSVAFDLTNMISSKVESLLVAQPGVKYVVADVGISSREDYFKALTAKTNLSVIECATQPGFPVSKAVEEVRLALQSMGSYLSYYAADVTITKPATTFERILQSRENDLDIKVLGSDLNVSYQIARDLLLKLKKVHYLTDLGIANEFTANSPEIWLMLDGEKIKSYNLTTGQVINAISDLVQKQVVTYFNQTDRKIAMRIIPTANGRNVDLESILDANVASMRGDQQMWIPVRSLVSVEQSGGYSSVLHDNQQRVVSIHANVAAAGIFKAASEIQSIASKLNLPTGYHISVGGKIDDIKEMFRGLLIIILLSIFVVYVILASEYESIIYPLVILTTSPFSIVGSLIMMYLFHQSYNLMSVIGLIIMFGAMDNDAVIAVDMITHNRRYGMGVKDAIMEGMRKRFRPIVMTTLTSILGMVPLIFGFGTGLELAAAISYPIIGGLVGSTIFTLFLIPVVYKYFDVISRTGRTTESA